MRKEVIILRFRIRSGLFQGFLDTEGPPAWEAEGMLRCPAWACSLGGGGKAKGRRICINKHSKMDFSLVQGKEKNKLTIVSSVSLLGKIKSWQPTLVPKTIFEILLWCKITIWEPPWLELSCFSLVLFSPPLSTFLAGSHCCLLEVPACGLSFLLERRLTSVRDIPAIKTFFLV